MRDRDQILLEDIYSRDVNTSMVHEQGSLSRAAKASATASSAATTNPEYEAQRKAKMQFDVDNLAADDEIKEIAKKLEELSARANTTKNYRELERIINQSDELNRRMAQLTNQQFKSVADQAPEGDQKDILDKSIKHMDRELGHAWSPRADKYKNAGPGY